MPERKVPLGVAEAEALAAWLRRRGDEGGEMTNPVVYCRTCGKQRDCMMHAQAENPPEAAKKWMRRHCHTKDEPRYNCKLEYRAGFGVSGGLVGQDAKP